MAIDPGPLVPDYFVKKFEDTEKEHSTYNKKINDVSFAVNGLGLTVNGWANTISALSSSVEGVKVGLGALALGFTPVKIDGALLKVDEKGIVFAGKQKWTWPHARDDKQKQEAADKRATKIHGKLNKSGENAQSSVAAARLDPRDTEKVRKAREDVAAFRTAYYNARPEIQRAQRMRDEAKAAEDATKRARERVQQDTRAIGQTVQSLGRQIATLESELVGH
ncbi:hypothetical protein [Streptomyces sp. SDr-06]|uniref:hypothetical protein n=1 Tax=Streptomyces sp. SDr-06 TaxID=2267702 RepID=UPI000DE9721C|nr:hypothetical protein [Streptomyces sp. SDr-06]RCH68211.1 hypothetical protein DT019_14635 [Streptomyces sp. SDr-06]